MPLTPETLTKHELVGLRVRVVSATNPDLEGIEGRVVSETMRTLRVESASRVRQVPKRGTTFEFMLTDEAAVSRKGTGTVSKPDDAAAGSSDAAVDAAASRAEGRAGDGTVHVTVDGATLLSRPELRTERTGDSPWQ